MNTTHPNMVLAARTRFAVFLYLVWQHLGLPKPTKIQIEIADYLQYGGRRITVHAFRGIGKSWITSAYVLWRLWNNPQLKFLIVSASKNRADAFSTFTRRLIQEMPLLACLKPSKDQRDSNISFDVGPAKAAHAPSVKSVGITGQMTGSRADEIIADDIEVLNNSLTQDQREKLLHFVAEFESILSPNGSIKFLGTPQTIETLYRQTEERGYVPRYWPARVPKASSLDNYGIRLAPSIIEAIHNGTAEGTPTDPERFTECDLQEREAAIGKSAFMLQFMLDTTLSDEQKYPLKTSDIQVVSLGGQLFPAQIQWGKLKDCMLRDIPCIGMGGDRWYKPVFVSPEWLECSGTVMTIDPAGRGKDQTAYAVVSQLHGNLFVREVGGFAGGYEDGTLKALAVTAKRFNVNEIVIEANFGDGMFTQLFTPVCFKIYQCAIQEVKHNRQKELRIIDTLEPLLGSHRLICDQSFVEREVSSAFTKDGLSEDTNLSTSIQYNLFYQMTRLTRDRNSLKHDDKLDALAMACGYWVEVLAQDAERRTQDYRDQETTRALEEFVRDCSTGKAVALDYNTGIVNQYLIGGDIWG